MILQVAKDPRCRGWLKHFDPTDPGRGLITSPEIEARTRIAEEKLDPWNEHTQMIHGTKGTSFTYQFTVKVT